MKKPKLPKQITLPDLKDWHAVVAIIAMTAIFFRDILLKNAFLWEDFLYQFYPFRNFAAVSMAHGELPLWNPYTFSGTPFQADIQSAIFYVPNLLLTFFVSGGRLSYYWVELSVVIHIMIAGIGMYYLTRDFGMHRVVALFSGLVFALSGFMITHAIHLVMISQVVWLPLIFLLFRRSLQRTSFMYMILAGLVLGHAVLAGFPQLSLYIFFFLLLYFLFEFTSIARDKGLKTSLPLVPLAIGMIVIALAVTAIQLLPTMELTPLSQRAEITYEKSQEGMLSRGQFITLVVPKYFGSSSVQGSTYWGPGQYWAYWETCFYFGIPAFIFVIFSTLLIKRNRYVAFFLGIGVFALLYALGDNFILHKFFFYFVPGFSKFRNVGRITILLTFSGAILGGFGLQTVIEYVQSNDKRIKQILLGLGAFGVLVLLAAQLNIFQPSVLNEATEQIHSIAVSEATTAIIFILISIIVLFLFGRRIISGVVTMAAILAIQFIDMNVFGFNQNNGTVNPEEYYNRTAQIVSMIKRDGENEYFRINARQGGAMVLDRNQGMVDNLFMMEGYTPLALQRVFPPAKNWDGVCDLLNAKYRIDVDEKQRKIGLKTASTYTPRAYLVYNDTVISNEDQARAFMVQEDYNPRHTVVLEEYPNFLVGDSHDTSKGSVQILSYHLNSILLHASTPRNAFLILSEIYYPGWVAYIDGISQKVFRADWSLRAIPFKPGEHQIEVKFEPESFRKGMWITLVAFGLSVVGIIFSLRKKKNNNQNEGQTR